MNSDRSRSSGHKLEHKKLWLGINKEFPLRGSSDTGTGCPETRWNLYPWRYSKSSWTQCWANCPNWICFRQGFWLDNMQGHLPTNYSVMLCLFLIIIFIIIILFYNIIILCKESTGVELKCSTEPYNNSLLRLLCLLQLSHPPLPKLLLFGTYKGGNFAVRSQWIHATTQEWLLSCELFFESMYFNPNIQFLNKSPSAYNFHLH